MSTYKRIVYISVIAVLSAIAAGFIPYGKTVNVEYEDSGKLLAYFPVQDQQFFKIRYIHSVHRTPVVEIYQIDGDDIVQTELIYENFAIGMPSDAQGDEKFTVKDGKYYITNMHRDFDKIDLQTGQVVANHTLILGEKAKPFKEFVTPGTWVRLKVEPLNFWQRLRGDEITWKKKD